MNLLQRIAAAGAAFKNPGIVGNDSLRFEGIIRVRRLPFETYDEYAHWWLPEVGVRNGKWVLLRPARMSDREKDRYTAYEHKNLLTQNGRTQILGYIGTPAYIASQTAFAQYFAVGNSGVGSVSAGDTVVAGEFARVTPSTAVPTGTQLDISCFFGSGQGNGTWTNVGLYGNGATSTLLSGTLMTHSLFSLVKSSSFTASADYLINLL